MIFRIISHYVRHRHLTFLGNERGEARFVCGCGAYLQMRTL